MKKVLLLSAFILTVMFGYAQTEGDQPETDQPDPQATESSEHGKKVSELAKTTDATGREKGKIISSAAREKALLHANENASFNRNGAHPENGKSKPETPVSDGNPTTNGKPSTVPPVTPPTTGKPTTTPVGKPDGVPVGSKPSTPPGKGN